MKPQGEVEGQLGPRQGDDGGRPPTHLAPLVTPPQRVPSPHVARPALHLSALTAHQQPRAPRLQSKSQHLSAEGRPASRRPLQEVAASLPASPIYDDSDIAIEMPGDRIASLPATPLPSTLPQGPASAGQGYMADNADDLLAGIPLARPHEYRLPTATALPGYRDAGYRGGSAFGDLKTFLVMFGVFAVVFVLLPRNR